jgi:hypothetical protein
VSLENKCSKAEANGEDLQTLMDSHRFLLHDYYDCFLSSHHSPSTRIWRNSIDSFVKLLTTRLPGSFDHLLEFLRLVYSMTISLFETTRSLQWIWTEVLGDISRYWMSYCELDIWPGVASYWYEKAASISPNSGRIQHHLATATKHNIVRELFYYSKALVSVEPFTPGRESMDHFCARVLSSQAVGRPWTVERTFVKAQALLFKRSSISLFDKMIGVFISGIDTHASCERDLFQRQGPEMACILFAALLDFGNPEALLWNALLAKDQDEYWNFTQPLHHPLQPPKMASITDDTRFSESEEMFTRACLSLHQFICVLFGRPYGEEPLQAALVILDSLNSISDMLIHMGGLMPWTVIATFLNTLQRRTAGVRYEHEVFPFQTPLPEDSILRGFV